MVVQTEKEFYLPGEVVNGKVWIQVTDSDIKAKQLTIEIKGKEQVKFKAFKMDGLTAETRTDTGKQVSKQEIFMKGEDIIVLFAHGDLDKGIYEGRFQFNLPVNTRSSCYWEYPTHKQTPFIKTKYIIYATLDRNEGQAPLRYKYSLMVHEKPCVIPEKSLAQKEAESITTWCCCS